MTIKTTLAPRERDVLALREQGYSLKEISQRLRLSPNTVKGRLKGALHKLHALSSLEAIYRLRPARCRFCPNGLAAKLTGLQRQPRR